MFCIAHIKNEYKHKQLIKTEFDDIFYYEFFYKKLTARIMKRIKATTGCKTVLPSMIDNSDMAKEIAENIVFYLVRNHARHDVTLLNEKEPDRFIERIIPYCRELQLVNCSEIDCDGYLNAYGYSPVQYTEKPDSDIVIDMRDCTVKYRGMLIEYSDNDIILPNNLEESLPSNLTKVQYAALLKNSFRIDCSGMIPRDVLNL